MLVNLAISAMAFSAPAMRSATTSSSRVAMSSRDLDAKKFVGGLPGAIAPLNKFDPLGFCTGKDINEIKRIRESELMHSRVAMLAVVGYLVGEAVAPIVGGVFPYAPQEIVGPANSHLGQQNIYAFTILTIAIGVGEIYRALVGWKSPAEAAFTLRQTYYPGDIGFDPLGLKPKNAAELKTMQERELSNGRLAMLAAAGFCAQEAVNGRGIIENLLG